MLARFKKDRLMKSRSTAIALWVAACLSMSLNAQEAVKPIDSFTLNSPILVAADESSGNLRSRQASVASDLRIAMLQEERRSAPNDVAETDSTEVDWLKQIEVTLAQQKTATATLEDLKSKQIRIDEEGDRMNAQSVDGGPPYSILLADQLTDSIASNEAKRDSQEGSLMSAREAVESGKADLENAKLSVRQFREVNADENDSKAKSLELEVQLAEETLVLRRQELAIEEAGEAVRRAMAAMDRRKLEIVKSNVTFPKQTLHEKEAELQVRENELKRKSELIQSELQYAERRWLSARQDLDGTPTPGADLLQRVEALKTAQQTIQIEQSVINQKLQRLPMMRNAWTRRYRVITAQASHVERREWLEETEQQLEQLERERRARELKLGESRQTLAALSTKLDSVDVADEGLRRWLNASFKSLSKQVELYNSSILGIESASRALTRLKVDIDGGPSRSVGEWFDDSWAATQRLWNYELTNFEDTSLTVGRVTSTVLFLMFGFLAARWLSCLLGNRLPKLGVDEAGAHAIESLSFYVLLIAFSLAALKYANVPLTIFTFLGGAIAIGVGFGSQNILNNFISGLILLAERPIKAGDLIVVGDTYGNVKSIGARSTTIRTGENQDIIVPNSKFLENEVTNLTRRDDRLRTSINIGVAYGSPLEDVIRLLELSASESPGVDARPKPFVWFNDFGDNALAFQLHFWIHAKSVSAIRKVETEVRLNVDRHFKTHGIVIAFPQRDLHLSSDNPIEFRMVNGTSENERRSA